MNTQEIAMEWVRRLRSGKIKQTTAVLGKVDGSRCCLGVLCDIAVEEKVIPSPVRALSTYDATTLVYGEDSGTMPPGQVVKWLFKYPSLGGIAKYATMNDQGSNFVEIANQIERDFGIIA